MLCPACNTNEADENHFFHYGLCDGCFDTDCTALVEVGICPSCGDPTGEGEWFDSAMCVSCWEAECDAMWWQYVPDWQQEQGELLQNEPTDG